LEPYEPEPGLIITNLKHSIGATTLKWSFIKEDVRRFQIGLNGLMAMYTNIHMHLTEDGGLDYRGKTNMPGVLLSGRVSAGGIFANVWGAKKHDTLTAKWESVGKYTVSHNVGHADYSVQITPETDQRICYIPPSSILATSFIVYFRNITGALADAAFSFMINGRNY